MGMGMGNFLWEWDGDRENLMEMGRDGDNLIYRVPLYRRQNWVLKFLEFDVRGFWQFLSFSCLKSL